MPGEVQAFMLEQNIVLVIFAAVLGVSVSVFAFVGLIYTLFLTLAEKAGAAGEELPPICRELRRFNWFLVGLLSLNFVLALLALAWFSINSFEVRIVLEVLFVAELLAVLGMASWVTCKYMK